MKVYLVKYVDLGMDGDVLLSVWSSEELAEAEIERESSRCDNYKESYRIVEFDLDEANHA